MSSKRKQESARANGAKSKGPVTPEGKAKSSMNAVTHGLAAETIVLEGESVEQYESLRASYIARFQPQDQPELDQVNIMIASIWRQRRMWTLETACMNTAMNVCEPHLQAEWDEVTDPMRIASAYAWEQKMLKSLDRYESRILRQYRQALKTLKELQSPNPSDPRSSVFICGENSSPNEPNPKSDHPATAPPPDPCSSVLICGQNNPPNEPNPKPNTPPPLK